MNYFINKLEFKALLYNTGLTKDIIVDIINMQDYFSVTYINGRNQAVKKEVEKSTLYDIINNHSETLLLFN